MSKSRLSAKKLALTAVLMAMNIIMSMSIFSIPVPGGHMYLNDLIICTAAILLDPFCAFMVGGVGAFIGDMLGFSEDWTKRIHHRALCKILNTL